MYRYALCNFDTALAAVYWEYCCAWHTSSSARAVYLSTFLLKVAFHFCWLRLVSIKLTFKKQMFSSTSTCAVKTLRTYLFPRYRNKAVWNLLYSVSRLQYANSSAGALRKSGEMHSNIPRSSLVAVIWTTKPVGRFLNTVPVFQDQKHRYKAVVVMMVGLQSWSLQQYAPKLPISL